ncbi:UvrD-helicase domain-containing protein [Alkalihalobacterium bogoriense]|uniref:UvrD-helicase domain-containing protein n=1 Tax=Alkalihalobacterium bogoriense TaxID=246272 RepID=UPI00047CCF31|nr:UvrD-helicase domain-containing protein [Alkalihalobacterium bogoriense]
MTKQIVDQRDRDKIKFNLHQNFLVEAGAGSGKTTSLVDRMVNLIYTETNQIEEIVAITFTRKAADELKTRFQNELEKVWKKEGNPKTKRKLEEAIQNVERCFIGTVHAFCARLLRERPIEANLDMMFRELEDEEDKQLAEEAWTVYLSKLQAEDEKKITTLHEIGVTEEVLLDRFQMIKHYPDVEWVATPMEMPQLETAFTRLITLLKEAKRTIPDIVEKGPDSLQKNILQALRKARYRKETPALIIEVFELFESKSALAITQKKWTTKEDAKEYKARIELFVEDVIAPLLQHWREYCHPIIISFLKGALLVYEQMKKEQSLLNFQDLLIQTTKLLQCNPEVRSYFQEKYRCMLVDEFQDTDPIQAQMMFFLTGENVTEQEWVKCKPRSGSLFVVGDPKQAIYRFRRADIDIYNKVKELICLHGGEVLQLTMNFRTIDSITEKLNQVFQEHLPEQESKYQAAYRPLHSFHAGEQETSKIKKIVVPVDFTKNQAMIIEKDAENICASIQALLQQGYEPKDMMIITRYHSGIGVYSSKLEQAGIPISVSGEMKIGTSRVFQELLILLETFVDLTNSVALVATLRSCWFGISDEQLYEWKQKGGSFSIYSSLSNAEHEPIHPVEKAFSKLKQYAKWVRSYSPLVAIEKIIEDVGFYPLLVAHSYGAREYTQFVQIIEALRKEEENGHTLYFEVVSSLTTFLSAKVKVVNLDEDANAVRILNVHKAKGLEAPIVFLAHPGKKTDVGKFISSHIKREQQASKGYFLFTKQSGFTKTPIAQPKNWDEYKAEEEAYLVEEEIRILYVAATRAEKLMIISSCEKKDSQNPWTLLLKGLPNLEEVEINKASTIQKEPVLATVTLESYLQETESLFDWVQESATPSFLKVSPTDEKESIHFRDIDREEGGGLQWGLVIHDVFEQHVKQILTDEHIRLSLQKHQLPVERKEEVCLLVEKLEETDIWRELQRADEVLTEVPFTLPIHQGDPLYEQLDTQGTSQIFLSGIIDLVYKIEGQWKIVDYKTDRLKDINQLSKLTSYYNNQVQLYKEVWEKLTNEDVAKVLLYYVTHQQVVEMM